MMQVLKVEEEMR